MPNGLLVDYSTDSLDVRRVQSLIDTLGTTDQRPRGRRHGWLGQPRLSTTKASLDTLKQSKVDTAKEQDLRKCRQIPALLRLKSTSWWNCRTPTRC